jgi:hypothetical protein
MRKEPQGRLNDLLASNLKACKPDESWAAEHRQWLQCVRAVMDALAEDDRPHDRHTFHRTKFLAASGVRT